MKLFFANINEIQEEHLRLLSPERAQKALRYRFAADRRRSIAAGLLLREFLGGADIFDDECGKPRTTDGRCFNLSHSGDWAILALSDHEIGCDIELFHRVDALRLGKTVFTERELDLIRQSPDRLGVFYRLWTRKEALLKCIGDGFHRAAKTVDVSGGSFSENGDVYDIQTQTFADYSVSVCVKNGSAAFETQRVHFNSELL